MIQYVVEEKVMNVLDKVINMHIRLGSSSGQFS